MTFATRRSLRRSQTVDHDELADTKIGLISMPPSTQPKRRGRPPKSSTSVLRGLTGSKPRGRPPKALTSVLRGLTGSKPRGRPPKSLTSSSRGKLTGSKPRGRPPGRPSSTAPHIMTDVRIALKLGWRLRKATMGKRVGDAARSVYLLSHQWPWDLVAGFKPKRWSIPAVENLRKLFNIIYRVYPADEHQNDFRFVKNYLRECAMKRDRRRPQLKNRDVEDACDYFADSDYVRRDVVHTAATPSKPSIATVMQEDENGYIDFIDYGHYFDDDDDDEEYVDIATPAKRSRTPSSPVLSPKRARTAEPTEPRQQTITDITNSLQSLHAQKQKELEAVTNSLDEIAASIQANEAAQINHINEKVDKLTFDVKAYETTREKILKARSCLEQHYEIMMVDEDDLAKRLQRYASDLKECDKLIAQAEADVYKELDQIKQRDVNLADEEKRLEGRVKEVLEEVRHCSVVEMLMRLGPGGMAKLLGTLEGNGVELVEMAESIMNEAGE
ncbi:uncharacterized protein FMAN_03939 [Fusarium mangiferae]|uniref:Uncharacterized protein n=1 Tax=Fusarium mangiferae TaxID=192010 RepID=A0A1L7U5W2_FUSMA|nr:uncharacterized protein FMAN_03939 [Fusarium mangiferae]CVL06074.1 uncharacterized protein FMAN_03939 [Fusarium mangiferae]